VALVTFLELFPRERTSTIEAAEYNRLMAEYADALRDFTLAHYRAGAPRAGEFWSALRAETLPESLAQRLDLYAASGRLSMHDHEPFEEVDWAWLLIGSGCRPESLEQHVRMYLGRLSSQEVAALRQAIQQLTASMPPHLEFLRRQAATAARTG
jgi:tryptophan halogenase